MGANSVAGTTSARVGGATMNPENEQDQAVELAAEDLIEEVSIDGMCGVY